MKVVTSAVLLALSGAAYAVPLPIGVLDNVQDNCSGMGAGCVSAGPFLHHLADSESKYLHLVHPETGTVMHVIAPSSSVASSSSSSSAASTNDHETSPSGKPSSGVYPISNHPASSTPFTEPPSISGFNSTTKPASLMADSSIIKPQEDGQLSNPSPVRPAGMAVAPISTLADKLLAKSTSTPLPGAASTVNQTFPNRPATSSPPVPANDDAKSSADVNSTNIADATGVAQAPNLVRINDNSPDLKDGAMGAHPNVLMPLCTVVLAAAGAIFIL